MMVCDRSIAIDLALLTTKLTPQTIGIRNTDSPLHTMGHVKRPLSVHQHVFECMGVWGLGNAPLPTRAMAP